MKKIFFVSFLSLFTAALAFANEIGVGYNHGGPTVRFKWEDVVVSEFSVVADYVNNTIMTKTDITLSLAPVNIAVYRGSFGTVSLGLVFRDKIIYKNMKGAGDADAFSANDFSLDLLLPELELNIPGVDGLKILGSLGIGTSWGYSSEGKLDSFSLNLFSINMANLGIVYYFDLDGAAKPAALPVIVPVKETPVK